MLETGKNYITDSANIMDNDKSFEAKEHIEYEYNDKKKRKDGEIFAVRALPLGGYCAMVGESMPELSPEEYQDLSDKDKEYIEYETITCNNITAPNTTLDAVSTECRPCDERWRSTRPCARWRYSSP